MDSLLARRQIHLIAETLMIAGRADIEIWLRGGWAMDFFLGEITRDHDDIDWFAWSADADELAEVLIGNGHEPLPGPPPEQQLDFVKDEIESSFGLLRKENSGQVVVAGGPFDGEPWPEVAPDGSYGRIGNVRCAIVNPRAQIQTKRMMPVWVPGRPRRAKDAEDCDRIDTALRGRTYPNA